MLHLCVRRSANLFCEIPQQELDGLFSQAMTAEVLEPMRYRAQEVTLEAILDLKGAALTVDPTTAPEIL
jgi:hypothetical protein